METRDEPASDQDPEQRPAATRRVVLLGAAGLMGTMGALVLGGAGDAGRRGRKNKTRNKNQSSATSVGVGGAGGAGGDAGAVTYVCDPDFENCVPVNGAQTRQHGGSPRTARQGPPR